MKFDDAPGYIGENFEPSDRLAVVLLNKRTGAVTQQIARAERIASPDFQAWLRYRNAQKEEVYISMNTLREDARGRTKSDIQAIRHIYLDFDDNGTEAARAVMARKDLPFPNYQINTSPGKSHVIWKVAGFTAEQAESLQKWLARDSGADPAATDSTRVLRLPGFDNHKYESPHLVWADSITGRVYSPEDFGERQWPTEGPTVSPSQRRIPESWRSQSERDWAYAMRALSRGVPVALIIEAIADYRRDEKPDPEYYATHTVKKAAAELVREGRLDLDFPSEPNR